MSKRKPLNASLVEFSKIEFIQRSYAVDAQGTKLNNLKFIAAVLIFMKT